VKGASVETYCSEYFILLIEDATVKTTN